VERSVKLNGTDECTDNEYINCHLVDVTFGEELISSILKDSIAAKSIIVERIQNRPDEAGWHIIILVTTFKK
jgi:hypothetical protein